MEKPRQPLPETAPVAAVSPATPAEPIPMASPEPEARATASALWITIEESGDAEADVLLMDQLENGLKALKMMHVGNDEIFLRIRCGERVELLVCSDEWRLKVNEQVVQMVSGTLGARGSVTIAEPPGQITQSGDSAAGL